MKTSPNSSDQRTEGSLQPAGSALDIIMVAFSASALTSMIWEYCMGLHNPNLPLGYVAVWLLLLPWRFRQWKAQNNRTLRPAE